MQFPRTLENVSFFDAKSFCMCEGNDSTLSFVKPHNYEAEGYDESSSTVHEV